MGAGAGRFLRAVWQERARRRRLAAAKRRCRESNHLPAPGLRCAQCETLLCSACWGLGRASSGSPACKECQGTGERREAAEGSLRRKVARWMDEAGVPWRRQ